MSVATHEQSEHHEHTDMAVGEILRRTREHYDQSIEDIERALRIRASQIEAIESGRLDLLPGPVYAVGFVKTYSEFLGLDGDKMVSLFKVQSAGKTLQPELHYPAPASDSKLPPLWLVIGALVIVFMIVGLWMNTDPESRDMVETIPPVPPEIQVSEEVQPIQSPVQEAQAAEEAAQEEAEVVIEEKPPEGIVINIRQNSWVEIRDKQNKKILSRVLKAGDQYYVPDRPDLKISIGNAAGVEIEVDGVQLRQLGEKGKVLRSIPLDAKYLKANFAASEDSQ